MQRRQSGRIHSIVRQVGFFTLDLGLALLVTAIATVIGFIATQKAGDADLARIQADALMTVRAAAHKLVMNNYGSYQSASPIVMNGSVASCGSAQPCKVTVPDGDNSGQSRNPTLAILSTLDLGVDDAADSGVYKNLTTASYGIKITRTSQCSVSSSDPACHVTGLVCLDKPVKTIGAAVGEIDDTAVGVMMSRMGGLGGASLTGFEDMIISPSDSWVKPNPYGGAAGVAGIVCAVFGWGTEGDDYLRVNDSRDPGFTGGESVSGTLSGGSTYTFQANGDANITGNLNVGDPLTHKGSVTINGEGVPNTPCTVEGSMVWGDVGGTQQVLKCQGAQWTVTGVPMSSEATPCVGSEGKLAQTSAGIGLVCRDGSYRMVADLMGRGGVYQFGVYGQTATTNSVVPMPVCSTNTVPHFVAMGVVGSCVFGGGACSNNTGAFVGSVDNSGVVTIKGSDGTVAGTDAQLAVASICSTY